MKPRRQVMFFHDTAQFMVMKKDVKDYCQFIGYSSDLLSLILDLVFQNSSSLLLGFFMRIMRKILYHTLRKHAHAIFNNFSHLKMIIFI